MSPAAGRAPWPWAALLCACSSGQAIEEQQSAARVARAVQVLRDAPNAAKAPALASLSQLACAGADVCETRDVCSSAYQLHVDALTLTEAARLQLQNGQQLEAAKVLGAAEEKLAAAGRRVAECTEREAALRRRYKL